MSAPGPFVPTEEQCVSDVVNYIAHGDPQVRGATAVLCGALLCSVLGRSRFRVGDWLGSVRTLTGNSGFGELLFLSVTAKFTLA